VVSVNCNVEMILVAETILAFLESFLATCFPNVLPTKEKIFINIIEDNNVRLFTYKKNDDNEFDILTRGFDFIDAEKNDIGKLFIEFTAVVLINNFFIDKPLDYIERLMEREELNERLSIIFHHRNFTINLLGRNPKFKLNDWIDLQKVKDYCLLRKNPPVFENKHVMTTTSGNENIDLYNISHKNIKVLSVIDLQLWDKAEWNGFGVMNHPYYGFGLLLCFKNSEAGIKIFEEWINRFGTDDKEDIIRISIIRCYVA